MSHNIDDIQSEIEQARRQLAVTLDEIADRAKPKNMVENTKKCVVQKLQNPKTQKILAGIGAVIAAYVVFSVRSSRRKKKEFQELKALLSS